MPKTCGPPETVSRRMRRVAALTAGVVALAAIVLEPAAVHAQRSGWLAEYQRAHRAFKARRYASALRRFTRAYPRSPAARKPAIAVLAATSAAHLGDLDAYMVWVLRAGKKLSAAARKKLSATLQKKIAVRGSTARLKLKKRNSYKRSPIPVAWVKLRGGKYEMGSAEDDLVHVVKVPRFQIMKAEVTQTQYGACVKTGRCAPPKCHGSAKDPGDGFTGKNQPAVCVTWGQARAFCRWIGGRLPSEAEWEYAAKSGGKIKKYPWGFSKVDCSRAVMKASEAGCGRKSTWPVCSKKGAHTEQGLCDMAGNVGEWVEDCWHQVRFRGRLATYEGAPTDGSAWTTQCWLGNKYGGMNYGRPRRVVRGGQLQEQRPGDDDHIP